MSSAWAVTIFDPPVVHGDVLQKVARSRLSPAEWEKRREALENFMPPLQRKTVPLAKKSCQKEAGAWISQRK